MRIALAGNPNCGKTTLYNAITGKTEYVGNWTGVTVEKKEAALKGKYALGKKDVTIVDLPGAYSISPYTGEEAITRDFIIGEAPDVIVNIVDGANFERSLFFTTQLLDLEIPVVIALNKADILLRRGDEIDLTQLSKRLDCPVVSTTATSEEGLAELMETAIRRGDSMRAQKPFLSNAQREDSHRQEAIEQLVSALVKRGRDATRITFSDRLDRIVAHKIIGLPIFFLIMWAVYWFSIEGLGGYLSGYFNDTLFGEMIPEAATGLIGTWGLHPLLEGLIVDGIIGGVGAVIGFLPLIMVLFFCLALLEDSGYMARVAVIMDRYFKKIGLSGKSIIPMIVGSGCSIPGIMATRTIEDDNERRMTTILAPFVPCGAKLPIIALFSVAFFPNQTWVGPSVYILAFALIIVGGLLLKRLFVWENTSSFILELPEYKIPSLKHAVVQMLDKAKAFIIKASTIILVMNTLVWFMQAFGWNLQPVEDQSASILAAVGHGIAPILLPLGFVGWQLAAAAITGFIAKENVVSTFAIVFMAASEEALQVPGGIMSQFFNPVTAYAFLAFNLFTPPCFAAIGAMRAEMSSARWLWRGLAFQLSTGYLVALVIHQLGSLIVYGQLGTAAPVALGIVLLYAVVIAVLIRRADGKRETLETGYSLSGE